MSIRYERADVIIVGGGLLGCWAALWARRRGLRCLLVDQGRPDAPTGQSTRKAPPLTRGTSHKALLRLKKAGLRAYRALEAEMGLSLLSPAAHWLVAPQQSLQWQAALQFLREEGEQHEQLSPHQLREQLPQLKPPQEVWALTETSCDFTPDNLCLPLWTQLRRLDVPCFADTAIVQLDLEYDQPTAVGREVAFRGKQLWIAVDEAIPPQCSQIPAPTLATEYLERFTVPPPTPGQPPLPHLTLLFQERSLQLDSGADHFTLSRLLGGRVPEDGKSMGESIALELFRSVWLLAYEPAIEQEQRQALQMADGLPIISAHPWRDDVVITTALGRDYKWLAPGAAELALELLQGTTKAPEFRYDRESLKPP